MRALTWRPRPKKDLVIRGETATLRLDAVVTPRTLQATATIHSVSIVATARIARGDEESGLNPPSVAAILQELAVRRAEREAN